MGKRVVNQELNKLLASGQLRDFTLSELMKAYKALPDRAHGSDAAIRQLIYRRIAQLEKAGLVGKALSSTEGGRPRYRWIGQLEQEVPMIENLTLAGAKDAAITLSCLKEKLHRYKVEMLSAIGETEEYDAVCAELPHMRSSVQALYNEARDRCSKMLGRVRALESILANQINARQS